MAEVSRLRDCGRSHMTHGELQISGVFAQRKRLRSVITTGSRGTWDVTDHAENIQSHQSEKISRIAMMRCSQQDPQRADSQAEPCGVPAGGEMPDQNSGSSPLNSRRPLEACPEVVPFRTCTNAGGTALRNFGTVRSLTEIREWQRLRSNTDLVSYYILNR